MASHSIDLIHAHEILDSRGNPTLKVSVMLNDGTIGSACVPSGASTGSHEALELRDGDKKRYGGKGVLKAVKQVNGPIAILLRGRSVFDQRGIDDAMRLLDGTPNKSRLGANAILGVSLACAHAGAAARRVPLYRYIRETFVDTSAGKSWERYTMPHPTMNILNGGLHAGWVIDLQECMIIPQQKKFSERVRCGAEVFHALRLVLQDKGYSTLVGDEGGYAVPLKRNEEAFALIVKAIGRAGYVAGRDVKLGIDPAASEFYEDKKKIYALTTDKKMLTSSQMITLYQSWIKKYPLVMIEDGLAEDDWAGWAQLTSRLKTTTLVGDDLFVTNVERIQEGIDKHVANAVLIKVNQIGTLSESIDAILLARQHGYAINVSHRSGETEDTTIADLAVAFNAEFIKTGSLSRSERLCKYNRLLEIAEELGK